MTDQKLLTCKHCGVKFVRLHKSGPIPKYCTQTHRQRAYEDRKINRLESKIKYLERENRKQQERLNRIRKLVPGRGRLQELDRHTAELRFDEALLADGLPDDPPPGEDRDRLERYRKDILFMERFEWDMNRLRDTVRGNPRMEAINYTGGKYDIANWEGERP